MPTRDEAVVREWQRRLRRQMLVSRVTIVAVIGLVVCPLILRLVKGSGGGSRGVTTAIGGVIIVLAAWIVVALILSYRGLRCPRCNAYQGRRLGERDTVSLRGKGPAACRACHTPFV